MWPIKPVTMYDAVDVNQIPNDATHAAGYVDGQWPTVTDGSLKRHLPKARLVSIATDPAHDADCLDVEAHDAANSQAPAWVRRQWARGVKRPMLYSSVGNWPALTAALKANGIKRRPYGKSYHRWSAHYTEQAHRCGRSHGMPGFVRAGATQWTNKALGRELDQSECVRLFFR